MAHFCLMVVGNNIKDILISLNKYNANNLEIKSFKKEMSYIDMIKSFGKNENFNQEEIENFAYNVYRYHYDKETNSFGIFVNPHEKFDNIKPGGRYAYNLNIKNREETTFSALKKDIDFDKMKGEAIEKAIELKDFFKNKLNYDEKKFKETFGSEEDYLLKSISDYCYYPYFINEEWHEQGEKGIKEWKNEFEEFFIKIAPNETIILMDCHK